MESVKKVKKLLAKAEGNPFPDEAKSAMLKAQELMVRHGISMARVNEVDFLRKGIITETTITEWGRTSWWQKSLAAIIAKNFRVYAVNTRSSRRSRLMFLGRENDTEMAKEVFCFAVNSIRYHSQQYIKTIPAGQPTRGLRNDYINGFLLGLSVKFQEQVESQSWGLVLSKDPEVEAAMNNLSLRKARQSSVQTAHSKTAGLAGYEQGKAFTPIAGEIDG